MLSPVFPSTSGLQVMFIVGIRAVLNMLLLSPPSNFSVRLLNTYSVHFKPTTKFCTMDSTPLLPRNNKPIHDHPIFFRVCHSPWSFLGQKSLLLCRTFLAVYTALIVILYIHYAASHSHNGRLFIFFAGPISYIIQTVYYLITAVCLSSR